MGDLLNKVMNFMGIGDAAEEDEEILEEKQEEFYTPEPKFI